MKPNGAITVLQALINLKEMLQAGSEEAALEAQLLLAHGLTVSRSWLLAHPEVEIDAETWKSIQGMARRRAKGKPLPYILGSWEFFSLTFQINPSVLIPRPETELLVETALDWLTRHPEKRRAADVGAGSGCIAVSLAKKHPELQVIACDLSAEALAVANTNAVYHQVANQVQFVQSDLLTPFAAGSFDLICANLPYIPTDTMYELPIYSHEPTLALDGGPDGLDVIRRLLADAPRLLSSGGLLLLEIESRQGQAVLNLIKKAQLIKDLAHHDRLIMVEF